MDGFRFKYSMLALAGAIITLFLLARPIPISAKTVPQAKTFTDADLKAFLKKHPDGVIYLVSPHMYLSLKGLAEYRALAQKHKVAFLPLLDPVTNTKENMLDVDLSRVDILNSHDLIARDATQHYPSFKIYKGGALDGRFNPGYDAPEVFEKRLKDFFK